VQWCSVVVVVQCGDWGIFLLTQKAILLVLVLVLGLFSSSRPRKIFEKKRNGGGRWHHVRDGQF
jgi:hypothetical protein